MKRGLLLQIFAATIVVALVSVVIAGLVARNEGSAAFDTYVSQLPAGRGPGMGTGRQLVLGAAEQKFLAALDHGIYIGIALAFGLAAVAAFGVAYYLTRPLERLTGAAQAIAAGDLAQRVDVGGPAEVTRLGESFNEMAASLAQAEELRRRLVGDVAHELRDPLAALRAQVEGVADGVLPADPARLASLADEVRYLSRLVGDLQELSSAEAGALRYEMQPLDLGAIVAAETARARDRACEGVEVRSECGAEAPVTGDEQRLAQVMRNLLGNALRHTERGSVVASCAREDGLVRVEVRDTGAGIPEKDLPYVFERFYRADEARARDTGGTGIGLALSRRIVEDHGGEVFARNAEDGGAVVGFTLPLA